MDAWRLPNSRSPNPSDFGLLQLDAQLQAEVALELQEVSLQKRAEAPLQNCVTHELEKTASTAPSMCMSSAQATFSVSLEMWPQAIPDARC